MKTSKTLNKGWWISLGIVVVVAILAVIIFVKPAPKTPAPIADPTTSATAKAVSGCNVSKGDTYNQSSHAQGPSLGGRQRYHLARL